jgi:probable F420-dependent oxidoreductase
VPREERAARFEEALPLLRRFWSGESVDHEGPCFQYRGASVRPLPVQQLDVWLGGRSRSELERCGRLGDGWLPSFCTPADVAAGIPVVQEHAARAGRAIDPEHFGALLTYSDGPLPEPVAAAIAARRPDHDPAELVAAGFDALAERIRSFVAAGASKFVVLPVTEPDDWDGHLRVLAESVLPLQS